MPVITFDTRETYPDELTAIIALCASLGGRLPTAAPAYVPNRGERPETVPVEDYAATTAALVAFAASPSEQLLAEAAATRTDSEQTFDPASLDASGVPWDERIHSSNKARVADGTWRKRRGVDDVTFGQVHGELSEAAALRGEPSAPATGTGQSGADTSSTIIAPTDVAPPPPTSPDRPAPPPPTATVDEGKAPPPPPVTSAESAPTAGTTASAPAASGGSRFAAFADFVQAVNAIKNPAIPYDQLNAIAQQVGVEKFVQMKEHADRWEDFYVLAGGQ